MTSRSISSSCSESASYASLSLTEPILQLEKATRNVEISDLLVEVTTKIKQKLLNIVQIRELVNQLAELLNKAQNGNRTAEFDGVGENASDLVLSIDVKLQIYICLVELISKYLVIQKTKIIIQFYSTEKIHLTVHPSLNHDSLIKKILKES